MEQNKGKNESRTLCSRAVTPEQVGFPLVAQVAVIVRQRRGRKKQAVGLVTSLPPEELSAEQWLAANRDAWGIENGLHQRLDVSLNDDRCRIRSPNGLWVFGILQRLAISLFMEWRGRQKRPADQSYTDFQSALGENNLSLAFRFVNSQCPRL